MLKLKLQYLDVKNWLIRTDPDAGKDWRQEEKGTTGWDGLMASPTQWTWVWASSRSWWWTGRSGVLQFMGLQRVRHDWGTELNRILPHISIWNSAQFNSVAQSCLTLCKVDVFQEFSCFFDDTTDVGNLISGSSAFSKSSLNIWKFTVHVLLKPGLEILSITSMCCCCC